MPFESHSSLSARNEADVTSEANVTPEANITLEARSEREAESERAGSPPGPVARGLAALVRAYQLVLSPRLASSCRFEPSCSAYAHEALLIHGAGRGGWLALRRLLRCHPFSTAGYDPVPPPPSTETQDPKPTGDNVVRRSGYDQPLVPAVPGRHDLPTEE